MNAKHVLVVFHSQSGRAESLALAVYQGARKEANIAVRLRRAVDANSQDLLWAQALLVVAPENFGSASGGIKDFFDRVYYPFERAECRGLRYALLITAGNDGSGCERQLERILTGMQAKKIQPTQRVYGAVNDIDLANAREMGEAVAAGLALGIF